MEPVKKFSMDRHMRQNSKTTRCFISPKVITYLVSFINNLELKQQG